MMSHTRFHGILGHLRSFNEHLLIYTQPPSSFPKINFQPSQCPRHFERQDIHAQHDLPSRLLVQFLATAELSLRISPSFHGARAIDRGLHAENTLAAKHPGSSRMKSQWPPFDFKGRWLSAGSMINGGFLLIHSSRFFPLKGALDGQCVWCSSCSPYAIPRDLPLAW